MDNFAVSARIREFDQRNGGNSLLIGGWFYYANGAKRDEDRIGLLSDPPENEYQRLTNILTYHKGRLTCAVRKFDEWKERLMMSACSNRAGLDELKRLQAVVGQCNEAVNTATANLAASDEGKRREARRKQEAENQAEQTSFHESVKAIRI